ncbi:MAG: efflux transporter outer membrane subunit [Novosphingobium sp.]|jgi:multidrug efflux system outer membrane protein|nr:efflux transporter outer membrane subunit [Novosphingobium sp.]
MRWSALLLGAAALAGCSMAPVYHRPASPAPPAWPVGEAYPQQGEAALPGYSYREVFADPRLRAVIDQALANNEDVRTALANIEAARAQYHIQRAGLFPRLDGDAGYRRSRGQAGAGAGNSFTAEVSVASWEIDIFGRIRSLTGAARERYLGSKAAARAARLTLVADVADAWITYGLDSSLLRIAGQTADAARDSVRLTRRRLDGGIAPRSDLRQAEIVLETAQADVANQTTLVAQDINALQLLVGAPVDPANLPATVEDAGARLREVPAGLDSAILLRRPDVIEAESLLRAANAEIGAARAALFPRITLTGLFGFASQALGKLFTGDAFTWQAGGGAGHTIFAAGAGRANVRLSEAQRDAALAGYRKAIESAFADVSDALARRGTIDAQLRAGRAGRDAAADNLHLAELRYRGGVDSYLGELTARQTLYNAERAFANTQRLRAANLVALYRSLGGDLLADVPAPRSDYDNHSQ